MHPRAHARAKVEKLRIWKEAKSCIWLIWPRGIRIWTQIDLKMRSRPWKLNFTLRPDVQVKGARYILIPIAIPLLYIIRVVIILAILLVVLFYASTYFLPQGRFVIRSQTHSPSCRCTQDRNPRSHFTCGVHSTHSQMVLWSCIRGNSSIGPKKTKFQFSAAARVGFEPASQAGSALDRTVRCFELIELRPFGANTSAVYGY
jgi:hypothetical protein